MTTPLSLYAIALVSIVLHEFAHGVVALSQGDTTARDRGRLTWRVWRHLDPVFSVTIPLLALWAIGTPVGSAKPMPITVSRMRRGSWSATLTILAGPAMNALLALLAWACGASTIARLNLSLAAFNLLPLAGLDGWALWHLWRMHRIRRGLVALVCVLLVLTTSACFKHEPYAPCAVWHQHVDSSATVLESTKDTVGWLKIVQWECVGREKP